MINKGIVIYWDNSLEFIEFDCGKPESISNTLVTFEIWDSDEDYTYKVTPIIKKVSESTFEITINYEKSVNPDLIDKNISWGKSTIIIDYGALTGDAHWYCESDPKQNGKAQWERVDVPLKGKRRRVTTTKLQREQARFRKHLLICDKKKCVLTEETTESVLEAAHIIAVSDGGSDCIGNGIILRSDLHRLYDSGAFNILSSGSIEPILDKLSQDYVELLKSCSLPDSTLNRIQKALIEKV